MKKVQDLFLKMVKAICELFKTNEGWRGNAMLSESIEKIVSLCEDVDYAAMQQQQNDTKGYTANCEAERFVMEDKMFLLGCRLKVYAHKVGDHVVGKLVTFSRTMLTQMTMSKLITKSRSMVECAGSLLSALEPYEITEEDLNELEALTGHIVELTAHRDGVKNERTENTAHLKLLFEEMHREIALLDTLVNAFVKDKEFLRIYSIARRIHDVRGSGGKKVATE